MDHSFTVFYRSYILFIISVLSYEFYHYDFTILLRSSNETALVEQALEQMPICNTHDRSRQEDLLRTFRAWTQLAHSHHLRYWISQKTLIGYTHRQGILPDDVSIDVTILATDTEQLFELKKANYSSMYNLNVHPQWMMAKASNRSHFPSKGIDFKMQNAQFLNQKTNVSINIWPIYDKSSYRNLLNECNFQDNQWRSIAEEWIFPLRPCLFNGIKTWCPAQPKQLTISIVDQIFVDCLNGIWTRTYK